MAGLQRRKDFGLSFGLGNCSLASGLALVVTVANVAVSRENV